MRDEARRIVPLDAIVVGAKIDQVARREWKLVERLIIQEKIAFRIVAVDEPGSLELKREWMPLDEIVSSVLNRLEAQLGGRAIHTDIPDDLPLLPVDPILFEQVFVNLLENVAKYTPKKSGAEKR